MNTFAGFTVSVAALCLAAIAFAAVLVIGSQRYRNRRRLLDPDNAPPAFGPELPHEYQGGGAGLHLPPYSDPVTIACCFKCGGGKNHPVHHGVRFVPMGHDELTEETLKRIEKAR